jgi:hypothetical protein
MQKFNVSYDKIKLGIGGTYINITKAVYDKPIAHVILNGENSETISSKIRNETRVSTLSRLIRYA